jgi:hypothetical protein
MLSVGRMGEGRMAGWIQNAIPAVPCTTCKPGPDGSPATGWTLVGLGALAFVGAIVMLVVSGRSRPAPDGSPPETAEPVAMDRVQREDLEQRAAQEAEERNRTQLNIAGGLAVAGLAGAVIGGFLAATTQSAIDDHKKQLHQAASVFASVAVDGPETCRQAAISFPTVGSQNSTPHCDPSPRSYAIQQSSTGAYTDFPMEVVFSKNFQADGEVTFHDTRNDRALCVRVPDSVAVADVDSAISSGACPDAPVTSSSDTGS